MRARITSIVSLILLAGCANGANELAEPLAPDQSIAESAPSTPSTSEDEAQPEADTEISHSTTTLAPIEPLLGSYRVEIVASYPHDPDAFTQGLEWHRGSLLESTGNYGESDRRRVDLETGTVELTVPLDDQYFGEGLTVVDDEVLQLSWREGTVFRSHVSDLSLIATQEYSGEGWGICFDGDHVVMSDGSSTLTRRDSESFQIVDQLEVTSNGSPVPQLNELECFGDQIVANVYGLDSLAVIDGGTGIVVAVVDASVLRPEGFATDDLDTVLNGVAHQPETGRWFLTGKRWPVLYEVEFVPE